MKLLRVGPKGSEKPAILAKDGTIRDLSGVVEEGRVETAPDLPAVLALC